MYWNEAQRRWRKHPDCKCYQACCVCRGLRPLDPFGIPINGTLVEEVFAKETPAGDGQDVFERAMCAKYPVETR
jgi:hypothetical protein